MDTVGDAEKYRAKLSGRFPAVKFVVAKKADSLYPVVSGASIVAKVLFCHSLNSIIYIFIRDLSYFYLTLLQVTRDRALREWVLEETAENMHKSFGSGYPGGRRFSFSFSSLAFFISFCLILIRIQMGYCSRRILLMLLYL